MNEYLQEVENHANFQKQRSKWLLSMSNNSHLKELAIETLKVLEKERYTYQWDWLGVPIIKMPEEVMLIQMAISTFKPTAIIEVGVARGGGLALYHSIQSLCGITPNILGIDIKYFDHTKQSLSPLLDQGVALIEQASTSKLAKASIKDFIQGHESIFVILDGDHSHENVLSELRMLDETLPKDSLVLVADTLLRDVEQTGHIRNWNKFSNPNTALMEFMEGNSHWEFVDELCDKVVLSESPQGWIRKVS
jgi:cephalosporin hydroxylase